MDPITNDGLGGAGLIVSGGAVLLVLILLFKTKLFDDSDKAALVKFAAGAAGVAAAVLADMPGSNNALTSLLGRVAIFAVVFFFVSILFGFFVGAASEKAQKKK